MIAQSTLEAMKRILGPEGVILDETSLEIYSLDAFGRWERQQSAFPIPTVSAVLQPSSTTEVAQITKLAYQQKIPIVPYGGGTGVMGGIIPIHGGIAVDMKKMNRVIEIDRQDRTATVEAGIILGDLDRVLNEQGLMLGHDPYSVPIATLGGAISTNGVGYRAAKYGSMGDQVLGLEIVLPNGEILQTRAIPKTSVGPSLNPLFIGAEGVFGIITRATVRVFYLPESRVLKTITFPKFEDGFRALVEMFSIGLKPALVDLTEDFEAQEHIQGTRVVRMYLVFEGYSEEVDAQVARTLKLCLLSNGEDIGPDLSQEYWDTRHDSAYQYKESFIDQPSSAWPRRDLSRRIAYPHVAIPASRLLQYRSLCEEICFKNNITIREYCLWTHPNLFSMILVDLTLKDSGIRGQLDPVVQEMLTLAQDMGGSMEYVHGVGTKLAELVPREMGAGMSILRALKSGLDPHNIMNPGKLAL